MPDVLRGIGERIHTLRKKQGLTLKQLGGQTNLSASYISQIENARVNPNLDTLISLGAELGVHLVDLFSSPNTSQVGLVRASNRRSYGLAGGGAEHPLLSGVCPSLQVAIIELPPHDEYPRFDSHAGEEFTYVLSGQLKMMIGDDQPYELGAGDIIYYRSTLPHRWVNVADEPLSLMVVNTPASL